jgi:hypothetical protein
MSALSLPDDQPTPARHAVAPRIGVRAGCEALVARGVTTIFGYPGGTVLPIYDVLREFPIRHVLERHEQGAARAADGYSRATGAVGAARATSAPGAINLVTGPATAIMDSVPMVAVTGNASRPLLGRDVFQETDIVGIALPVTKYATVVIDPDEVPTGPTGVWATVGSHTNIIFASLATITDSLEYGLWKADAHPASRGERDTTSSRAGQSLRRSATAVPEGVA